MVTLYCYHPLHCNPFVMYLREGPLSLGWGGAPPLCVITLYKMAANFMQGIINLFFQNVRSTKLVN